MQMFQELVCVGGLPQQDELGSPLYPISRLSFLGYPPITQTYS